tara:strand:+ start:661 stop:852 length:192 start_codon:yes stop_codon:yes gene_type:complete
MEKIFITKKDFFKYLDEIPIENLGVYKIDIKNNCNYYIKDNYKYCMENKFNPLEEIFYKIKIK